MYRDKNGLITTDTDGTSGENSFLWTVELYFVLKSKGESLDAISKILDEALVKMYLGKGLYKQAPHLGLDSGHDSLMSHDQLTAIICYLKDKERYSEIKEIVGAFKYGISYNNVNDDLRPYHPRDLIFYNIIDRGIISYIFLPLLWLITMYTFINGTKHRNGVDLKKTDGELIYYVKSRCTSIFKPIDWFCDLRIKQRFNNWDGVFSTYFREVEHPLNIIKNK